MLQNYYYSAYTAVRASCAGCYVMLAPRTAEQDSAPKDNPTPTSWLTFMSNSSYSRVLLDLHKCAAFPNPKPHPDQFAESAPIAA